MTCGRIPALALILVLSLAGASRPESKAEAARRRLAESRSGLALPPPAKEQETSETYDVGAHFRGTVKKSFHHLGTGTLAFKTLARDRFSVSLEARVKHPKSQELLECRVQREYKLDGKNIRKVNEKDWFNKAASAHKKRFIDCVSLGYAVKWFTPREDARSFAPLKFNLDKSTYEVTYVPGTKWLEATLRSADGIVGRFFLERPVGGVRPVDKFRIHAKDELVVSFVRKGLDPAVTAP